MASFQTPGQFRDFVYTFQQSRIILSAYELDLFSIIGSRPKTSQHIANTAETDERATDRLLNALVAIGLLEKENGLFRNTGFSEKYLDKNSPDFLYGYFHTLNMWNTWTGLTDTVKSGKCKNRKEKNNPLWTKNFIAAMHERAQLQASDVVSKIVVNRAGKILDIGGGSGAYSFAFLRQNKAVTATVFDLAEVIEETRMYANEAGLGHRMNYLAGDYHKDPFGEGYDLIFMSAIVHINSSEENVRLVAKCAEALNPGGMIVIQDHVMAPDRTTPAAGAFFALNMLVSTERGDTYTGQEIISWMEQAGLSNFQKIPTMNNAMIIGTKEV